MRAAIYARYSTDLQSEKSVEDQVALCRAHAARERIDVVAAYDDKGRSGATIAGRPGLQALLAAALTGGFDAILVEHLDRLSRDLADLAEMHKRLAFIGVKILAVHGGEADLMRVGLEGLMGQLHRENNAKKVRRGLAGVVRSGRSAGGRAYGYRPAPGRPGELVVEEAEAAVVRRIFAEYLGGRTPREIAQGLNADRVPAPRGAYWRAATIGGNKARGYGMLRNPLYAGRIVWGRVTMVRDPGTGKRLSRAAGEAARHEAAAPHLAVVEAEAFAAATRRMAERAELGPRGTRRPRHILSGLLRCAACGSGMPVKDRDHGRTRIVCAGAHEAGICAARAPVYLDRVERCVVGRLAEALADREALELYVSAYNDEMRRLTAGAGAARAKLEARLGQIEREHARTLDGYVKGFVSPAEAEAILPKLREDRAAVEAELARADKPAPAVRLLPSAVTRFAGQAEGLARAMAEGLTPDGEAAIALRALVRAVVVHPRNEKGALIVEIEGALPSLPGDASPSPWGGRMVAGERLILPPLDVSVPFSIIAAA
jgi:DNA invertase Pin-like site-specific DNA recombinase